MKIVFNPVISPAAWAIGESLKPSGFDVEMLSNDPGRRIAQLEHADFLMGFLRGMPQRADDYPHLRKVKLIQLLIAGYDGVDIEADAGSLEAFARRVGYPLVAKPMRGFASRGVHVVRDAADLKLLAQRDGYLFQEYLGDPKSLEPYFESLRGPPPLFAGPRDPGRAQPRDPGRGGDPGL